MRNLSWERNIWGTRLSLSSGQDIIGNIFWQGVLSSKAIARINDKEFIITRDLLSSRIEIYDVNDRALLAQLSINIFSLQSEVLINGKRFEFEAKNFWQSGWAWKFNGTDIITYTSNDVLLKDKGSIELYGACNDEIEILILLGLVLRNYFSIIFIIVILLGLVILL